MENPVREFYSLTLKKTSSKENMKTQVLIQTDGRDLKGFDGRVVYCPITTTDKYRLVAVPDFRNAEFVTLVVAKGFEIITIKTSD